MYVDAKLLDDTVYVSERTKEGLREVRKERPPYVFYYTDEFGDHRSITGDRLKRLRCWTRREFERQKDEKIKHGKVLHESDVHPVNRLLEENYSTDDLPPLHITLYDIETDKDPDKGWSNPENPYAPITAITVYHKWLDAAITLAVPPPTLSFDEAIVLCGQADHEDGYGALNESNGYYLVQDEAELIKLFLDLITDTDILTGWNSDFYDLPYIINRIRMVLGGESLLRVTEDQDFNTSEESQTWLQRLNAFPCQPRQKIVENYGKEEKVYELFGRKQLDYRDLYEKFVGQELHSTALEFVLQHEVSQSKVKYDGSIGDFYRNNFRGFLAYNRQDVMGMSAIDDKRRLIQLANQMVHMAGVTFDKVTGSVAIIEQAVLKNLHKDFNLVAWDKIEREPDRYVPGAFVVEPHAGLYNWGANFDVDSLYPNNIITLNISPDTLVGQFDQTRTMRKLNSVVDDILGIPEDMRRNDLTHREGRSDDAVAKAYSHAWQQFTGALEYHDVIDGNDAYVTLNLSNGTSMSFSGKEWQDKLRENNWCVSGNGTVFDMSRKGIVAHCLSKWYAQRVEYKNKAKDFKKLSKKAGDAGDKAKQEEYNTLSEVHDLIQTSLKLFLNSTYGAYLNRHFRFYDSRCGRSVTLSGRVITKHMCKKAGEVLVGTYEFDRKALIYGDTDSCYVTLDHFLDTNGFDKEPETAISIADELGKQINDSFPAFVWSNFLVPMDKCTIRAKREFVFDCAIFKDKKKRYALHVVDAEGARIKKGDKEEFKITGMEVKRSDTPKHIQDFLKHCLEMVLSEAKGQPELAVYVNEFRTEFRKMPSWKRGSPSRVSNLTDGRLTMASYDKKVEDGELQRKPTLHWSVTAALNTNKLMQSFSENRWDIIRDGDKVEVLYLKTNEYGYNSVAIRSNEAYVPEWFQNLPFDNERHEEKLITQKLDNIFGDLGWSFIPRDTFADEFFV